MEISPQHLWFGMRGIRNDSPFAGGTDLDGDGIWGYEHRALSMKFNKSVFCFGNRITVITSDIARDGNSTEPFRHHALSECPCRRACRRAMLDGRSRHN